MLAYSDNPSVNTPLSAGKYVDIYNDTADINLEDSQFLRKADIDTENSEIGTGDIGNALRLISGIDLTRNLDEGKPWTSERALQVINETRGFMRSQLSRVLSIRGVIARINAALFESELLGFDVEELESYCDLFRLDYSSIDRSDELYKSELIFFVLEFNYWMLDRLRHWQWRDEVFFNSASVEFQDFPGASVREFENAEQLHLNGPGRYYPRAGSITREFLLENFEYFDLCHMAGFIALGADRQFIMTNEANATEMADTIIVILSDFVDIDPRSFITPFGPRRVHNEEPLEKVHNFNRFNDVNNVIEESRKSLIKASYSAGLSIYICSNENNIIDDEAFEKPTYALAEEVAAQYLSPQFFTGIESHRNYLSALTTFESLSGVPINEHEEGSIIFYGIGHGTGNYRFYTWKELESTFASTLDYVDPYSISKHPENPQLWSRFSYQSIERLRRVILPYFHRKYKANTSLGENLIRLETTLLEIDRRRVQPSKNIRYIYQDRIVDTLRREFKIDLAKDSAEESMRKKKVSTQLTTFFLQLFNLGSQLSDWEENFERKGLLKESQVQIRSMLEEGEYRYLDPLHSDDLHGKVFEMTTLELEKYANVEGKNGNLKPYIYELRLVRFFEDRYCVAYGDELESIGGRLILILDALKLGYFDFIRTSGNWLLYTAVYYMEFLFEDSAFAKMLDMKV